MSFVKASLMAFTGFVAADVLSDRFLNKGQKLDYGFVNKYLGRRVDKKWWGTRLEHTITLPAYLTVVNAAGIKFWQKYAANKGKTFGVTGTPLAQLFHCFSFVWAGVMVYVVHNAYLNPYVEDKKEYIKSHLYPTTRGCFTMLSEPITIVGMGKIAAAVPILSWFFSNALGGAIHFSMVKTFGFEDYKKVGMMTQLEREENGHVKKEEI